MKNITTLLICALSLAFVNDACAQKKPTLNGNDQVRVQKPSMGLQRVGKSVDKEVGTHTHSDGTVHRDDAHEAHESDDVASEKIKDTLQRLENASKSQQRAAVKIRKLEIELGKRLASKTINQADYDEKMARLAEMKTRLSDLRRRHSEEKRTAKGMK